MGETKKEWESEAICFGNCIAESGEMNRWRNEECSTPADTYIEWRFEYKCNQLKDGYNILTEWRARKRYYISVLQTIHMDYPHFSRHDDSHSVNILVAVEMLLGKERIDKLSAGDLWMLLECAYAHDLGMALTRDELEELWKTDEKFREYIESALATGKNHLSYNAANYYTQIDNLLRGKKREERLNEVVHLERMFPQDWPIEFSQSIGMLMTEYLRKKHAERIWSAWEKRDKISDPVIPKRLDRAVQIACELHGEDFSEIMKLLNYCCKGFGNERIHPRFAAAMLALGDMLDLDNNRFNPRAVERVGKMPYVSMLHQKKHEAITHLAIKTSGIEVEAVSKDIEVCKVLSGWFYWLEKGTKELICSWNEIAPAELRGCLLKPCKCVIYLESEDGKKRNLFTSKLEREFTVDKRKLIKLLSGDSIYENKIDFIREYLQNALDATKMQLWQDLKNGKYEYSQGINSKKTFGEMSPFDIDRDIYDQYKIQVWVKVDAKHQKVRLKFVDFGIGMEKECVDVLSKIGSGWRGRKKYSEDISKMPQWLRPTGGFGIGVQSAFMVTDRVVITTKDEASAEGRRLILTSPDTTASVSEAQSIPFHRGTMIEVELDIFYFYESQREYKGYAEDEEKQGMSRGFVRLGQEVTNVDFFEQKYVQQQIEDFLQRYIEVLIPNALFPIRIVRDVGALKHSQLVENQFWPCKCYWTQSVKDEFFSEELEWRGEQYLYIVYAFEGKMQVTIWNSTENICYYFLCYDAERKQEMRVCFKNVLVKEAVAPDYLQAGRCGVLIDIMGFHAEEVLKVHRDKLDEGFQKELTTHHFKNAYLLLFDIINKFISRFKDAEKLYSEDVAWVLFRLLYLNEDLRSEVLYLREPELPLSEGYSLSLQDTADLLAGVKDGQLSTDNLKRLTQMEFIRHMINFMASEDSSFLVCLGSTSEVKPEASISTSIWKQKVAKTEKSEEKETVKEGLTEELEHLRKTFVQYLECKERMILFEPYASILYRRFKEDQTVICEPYEFDGKSTIYVKFTKSVIKSEIESEADFLRKSYQEGRNKKRYSAKVDDNNSFVDLSVNALPFVSGESETQEKYIISPIGENVYQRISEKENIAGGKLDYNTFEQCIIEEDDFIALVKYVFFNRKELRLSIEDIRSGYLRYIRRIYTEVYLE